MVSWVVVQSDGTFDTHDEPPTFDALAKILAGEGEEVGMASLVRLPEYPVFALWVNDNYAALTDAGQLKRNPIGTALAVGLGATEQPYAGPVVMTGLDKDPMEGWSPVPLPEGAGAGTVDALHTYQDIAGVASHPEWRTDGKIPAEVHDLVVEETYRELAMADGPWGGIEVQSFDSVEDALSFLTSRAPRG